MSTRRTESETAFERKSMGFWVKWGAILGCIAAGAVIFQTFPLIGMYVNHVEAVWHAPDQLQRVGILESNQVIQGAKIQSITENIQDIRQDVRDGRQDIRDIKNLLFRPTASINPVIARSNKTNSTPQ